MIKTIEKLTNVLERNEDTIKKLVRQLESMDKNFKAFADLLSLLGEGGEEEKVRRK